MYRWTATNVDAVMEEFSALKGNAKRVRLWTDATRSVQMSHWIKSVASMDLPIHLHVPLSTVLAWHLLISFEEPVQAW